jgi:hypothetical protein
VNRKVSKAREPIGVWPNWYWGGNSIGLGIIQRSPTCRIPLIASRAFFIPYQVQNLFGSRGGSSGPDRLQSAYPVKLTHNASRIANRQTIGWDISGHDATRADSGVASNANSGKDYRARADPHMIFDDNWCGWRRYLTLFDAMLVPIENKQVVT